MTTLCFLWHMHQPYYEDLVTREHILPWVRLHALKDYYGMAALLDEFPSVRVTFNLVPSLLVQLEAFAGNRAHDRYLNVGLKPADSLTADDIGFMMRNFFHAQRQRMIEIYPRYAELLARRGAAATPSDVEAAGRRFTVDDLRDLQVWQKLAWMDPYYLDRDQRVRGLVARGQGFTEEDKGLLRAAAAAAGRPPARQARYERRRLPPGRGPRRRRAERPGRRPRPPGLRRAAAGGPPRTRRGAARRARARR